MAKLPPQFEIDIEKLSVRGEGTGRFGTRPVSVAGAFPGERALVRPQAVRKTGSRGALLKIIKPRADRREPREAHYLSCSPWSVLPENVQREYKKMLAERVFRLEAAEVPLGGPETVIAAGPEWGYRNKMEFSFGTDEEGRISLGFHERGRRKALDLFDECALAHPRISEAARTVVAALREQKANERTVKSLVIRYSYKEDACVAVLYVTDEAFAVCDVPQAVLKGWKIVFSNPLSPASVITRELYRRGSDELEETIGGKTVAYGSESFFQVNPPAFDELLRYVRESIAPNDRLIDLYAGVGTIGIALADTFTEIIAVERDAAAVRIAHRNAERNGVRRFSAYESETERYDLENVITRDDTVVIDPPRTGMLPKAVKGILAAEPKEFIYISCNPATQARDYAVLKEKYEACSWCLFDLYPQTPHVESVLILRRK